MRARGWRSMLLAVLAAEATVGPGCAGAGQRHQFTEIIMGVEARITLYAPNPARARAAARTAFDRMIELEGVMSDYRPDSELMRLGRAAGHAPVPVSDDLYRVLERGQRIAEASGGAFDMTVGPVVRLWREGRRRGALPDPEALARARALTGWRRMRLDPDRRTVELPLRGMGLDLGGIGKGFAADEALASLERAGCPRGLVDLGGDVAVGRPPPGRRAWRIEIQRPGRGGPPAVLELSGGGVATSGPARQFLETGGVRYSHIVDPRTGLGLRGDLQVTVVAGDAATADALASAASVLGVRRGRALVAGWPGASARFIDR